MKVEKIEPMQAVEEHIMTLLQAAFSPDKLEVINESSLHAGHREAGESTNSHFRLTIKADSLRDMPRLAQHKAIYKALQPLMNNNPIHALAIEVVK